VAVSAEAPTRPRIIHEEFGEVLGTERPPSPEEAEAARRFGNLPPGGRLVEKLLPSGWYLCIVAGDARVVCPSNTNRLAWIANYAKQRRDFDRNERRAGRPIPPVELLDVLRGTREPDSTSRGPSREARRAVVVTRRSRPSAASSTSDPDPPLPPRPCTGCGAEFFPRRPLQKYHDARCSTRARVARHRDRLRSEASDALLRPDQSELVRRGLTS
jgi:hypothetical protein